MRLRHCLAANNIFAFTLIVLSAFGLVMPPPAEPDAYYPDDARLRWFKRTGQTPQPGMPKLQDEEHPPLLDRGTRAMRDDYNSRQPLTLILEATPGYGFWLMSARNAAWRPGVLLANNVVTTWCLAPGSEAHRARGIRRLPVLSMNDVSDGHYWQEFCGTLVILLKAAETHGGWASTAEAVPIAAHLPPSAT